MSFSVKRKMNSLKLANYCYITNFIFWYPEVFVVCFINAYNKYLLNAHFVPRNHIKSAKVTSIIKSLIHHSLWKSNSVESYFYWNWVKKMNFQRYKSKVKMTNNRYYLYLYINQIKIRQKSELICRCYAKEIIRIPCFPTGT